MTKKYTMLVMSNAGNNNNKFYELKLEDNDEVVIRYGRVGATGTIESKGFGEDTFNKVADSKRKKGYKDVNILTTESVAKTTTTSNLLELAKRDVAKNDPVLEKLIEKLTKINRHQLLGASGGNIDIVDGQVKTPLGLVTLDSVDSAKKKLYSLNDFVTNNSLNNEYVSTLEEYLTLVPQKIPSKRGWHNNFFTEFTNFQNQLSLLEQIELSIKNYQPPVAADINVAPEKLFGYSLELLQDDKIFNDINKFYKDGINKQHVTRGYHLSKVYVLSNDEKRNRYEEIAKRIGNVVNCWHGTRAVNVLSIMKNGLFCPPRTSNYTLSGLMFGFGTYFALSATKSLNYATPYWSGGKNEIDELYMFHATLAQGKTYVPKSSINNIPNGYDSVHAKAGYSNVINDELVAPNVDQYKLNYLCEFVE